MLKVFYVLFGMKVIFPLQIEVITTCTIFDIVLRVIVLLCLMRKFEHPYLFIWGSGMFIANGHLKTKTDNYIIRICE